MNDLMEQKRQVASTIRGIVAELNKQVAEAKKIGLQVAITDNSCSSQIKEIEVSVKEVTEF